MIPMHISVCICTYKRPLLLKRLLDALYNQKTGSRFTYSIVVSDNDADKSAEEVVSKFRRHSEIDIVYCLEPRQNIALTRNAAIRNSSGEFIAFIDDDEFPNDDWLGMMMQVLSEYSADGVLGPVRPHFDELPPRWVIEGRFCERPEHPTGKVMKWNECRTGNLLFRRSILASIDEPFDPKFATGGEDMEFFLVMTKRGRIFVWCNEAAAYETVPPSRLRRKYMLARALLRGRNILKHSAGRWKYAGISVVAVPFYVIILPVVSLRGHHWFMKYSIKLCDHLGRLLALVGLNPVSGREV